MTCNLMRFAVSMIIPFCVIFSLSGAAHADSCTQAVEMYNRAVVTEDLNQKEHLYQQAMSFGCNDPEISAKIHNNLADTYEKQGNLSLAIPEYQRAIKADPLLPTPYQSLAEVYTKLNRTKEAASYREKAFLLESYLPSETIVASLSPSRAIRLQPQVALHFGLDESRLDESAIRQLVALVNALKDRELLLYRFLLEGHTCSLGTAEHNQALSERRAEAVKRWLVSHGILEDRLLTKGFGENRPVADNSSEDGRMRNRRVDIRTIGVAMLSTPVKAVTAKQKEALQILRTGEQLLMQERYHEAVTNFTQAKKSFEAQRFNPGIQAALKDLTLAYRFLEDWEKAEQCREQLEGLIQP